MSMPISAPMHSKIQSWEGCPLVGPLAVSPLHAIISVVEVVVGIAGAILFGILSSFLGLLSPKARNTIWEGAGQNFLRCGVMGVRASVLSVINFATVGIFHYPQFKR